MWCDNLPEGQRWTSLWHGLILCKCRAIRKADTPCVACGSPVLRNKTVELTLENGELVECPMTFMGAEGRYEDYVYLEMLQREWERPNDQSKAANHFGMSQKTSVVLLFWSYFETRIERLLRLGMREIPTPLLEDTLERYSSIGARLTKLYKIVFGVTYENELKKLGHEDLWKFLHEVQKRRNKFMHGHPPEIDDSLAEQVVSYLKTEHEAWIDVYNRQVKELYMPK